MKIPALITLILITLLSTSCSDGGVPVENPIDTVEVLSQAQMSELKLHALPVSDLGFEVEKTGNYFIKIGIGKEDVEKYWGGQPYDVKGKVTVSKTNRLEKKIVAVFDLEKDVNRIELGLFEEKSRDETSSEIKVVKNSTKVTKGFIFNAEEEGYYLVEFQFIVPQQVPLDIKTFVMANRQYYLK